MKMMFCRVFAGFGYKLSKVSQAIENNDLSTASSVLGGSTDKDLLFLTKALFNRTQNK
jgi:hypothetical protein